ncbi:hypothetical protein P22_2045 [Propionispora sp. 2/2-37]|uniref:NUDIX hydrolase n=1 Tax=Propionispora sp. 2/2-37 TaxID=1677858 RepID=UPI0006BB7A72|nr:NUDIX hydrolase [Propionispora sp. 2/2-37]CUH95957.1 hypothetical protein P22_2045 [Propionispora sp. 2/2-37]
MSWLAAIEQYQPYTEQERKDQHLFLHCAAIFPDILNRKNELVHVTSSACAVNKKRDKLLMVHHNVYKTWSWPGGHADGEENLLAVAIKELKEETGVRNCRVVLPDIFSLDILPVLGHCKRQQYVSAHLHLSVAYLLEVNETETFCVKQDENSAVKWMAMDAVSQCTPEPHMQEVYAKIVTKIRSLSV